MKRPIGIEMALRLGIRRIAFVSGFLVFVVTSSLVCLLRYESVSRNVAFLSTQMMRQLVRHSSDEDSLRLRQTLLGLVDDFQKHADARLSFDVSLGSEVVVSSQSSTSWQFEWRVKELLPNGSVASVGFGVDADVMAPGLAVGVSSGLLISLGFLLLLRRLVQSFVLPLRRDLLDMRESKRPVHFEEFVRFFDALEESRRLKSYEVIAQTTQSLAHDVRKPFSMFKSIIQVIEGTEDPSEVRKVLQLTLPEVNQAMASVEGMIQDVMQIGSDATMNLEDAAPSTLIEAALGDLFRIYPEADVSLSYDFSHRHMVRVDSLRVERVFANILGNAMQAMRERGNLWVRTLERDGFIEFTLGNGGSHIPHESLPKLFDAFFTSGKKGGTGLGLAIAKKIVEAHGGAIHCVSKVSDAFPQGMVEFVFTLPVAQSICAPRLEALPRTSREIQSALAGVRIVASRQEGMGADPREAEIESAILQRINQLPETRPQVLTVLVVEDEGVYRNGLLSLLEHSENLSRHVRMVFAYNDSEALAAIDEHNPVLVIEDVDLGATSRDGIEIVTMLRAKGFKGHICVHSNRFLAGDNRAALAAGADTVLPKPLGRAHFLKLLLASLPEISAVGDSSVLVRETTQHLSVAMIDDSVSMRVGWRMEIGKHTNFRSFASSGAFLEACDREEVFLSHLEVVVTDYNFAPGDPHDGGTLARELRRRGYQGLILRASGQANLGSEVEALFDADIGKSALSWPEFQEKVAEFCERRNRI